VSRLKLSVIVPAFNEEKLIAGSLAAIRDSMQAAGLTDSQWELRVCDNASDDATARIAAAAGAIVVYEAQRQISVARNSGAADATGEWLLFVDADTTPGAALVCATRRLMESEHCCGGVALVDSTGLSAPTRVLVGIWNTFSRIFGFACGAYVFCRHDAFTDLEGFSVDMYAAEELDFSWRLRQWGREHGKRFVVITNARLLTSMRKLDLYTPWEILSTFLRVVLNPTRSLKGRQLLDHWYDGRR
jgi:glycosyltransferase involved in cell wall biosynthesis